MVTPTILGVVCGLAGALVCLILLLLCRLIMRRKSAPVPPTEYKAIGDYKPLSYIDQPPKLDQVCFTYIRLELY